MPEWDDFAHVLIDLLQEVSCWGAEERADTGLPLLSLVEDAEVLPFSETGLLTSEDGCLVRLADGREFQIFVKQSK